MSSREFNISSLDRAIVYCTKGVSVGKLERCYDVTSVVMSRDMRDQRLKHICKIVVRFSA